MLTIADTISASSLSPSDLDQGEAVLLPSSYDPGPAFPALLDVSLRFLWLHGLRLLASMLASAVLRRHLMVWKIFAPRLIFEVVGFGVTAAAVVLGYLVAGRVLRVLGGHFDAIAKER